MNTFKVLSTDYRLAIFLLSLCCTIPVQAWNNSLPVTHSSSGLLAQAPQAITFYLFDSREAVEPILVQALDREQWQTDVRLDE